jgi:hypothetical protein
MTCRIFDLLAGISLFMLVATPSMKMLIPVGGELLNVVPLFLALFVLLLRPRFPIWSAPGSYVILVFLFFFLALLISAFIPPGYMDLESLVKYMVLMSVAVMVPIVSTTASIELAIRFLLLWAAFVAALQISVGIDFGEKFNYLTIGLPVAAGILIALAHLFSGAQGLHRWWSVLVLVLCVGALLSLPGRGAIIFPVAIVMVFLSVRAISSRSWGKLFSYILLLLFLFVGAYLVYLFVLPDGVVRRIDRMVFSFHDEPRVSGLYLPALEAIVRNPFGYGLEGAGEVVGYYPHNIFLEVLISSGIVGLLFFLPVVLIFGLSTYFFMKNRFSTPVCLSITFLAAFHFLFWNVSHPLSSGYALFALLVIQGLLWARLTNMGIYDQRCNSNT